MQSGRLRVPSSIIKKNVTFEEKKGGQRGRREREFVKTRGGGGVEEETVRRLVERVCARPQAVGVNCNR